MLAGMHFCRMLVVLGRMQVMPMGDLGVVRGLFMIAGLMVLRSLAMVFSSVLMVVGSLFVMFMNVVVVHRWLPGSRFVGRQNMVRFDEVFAKQICQAIR